MSNSTKKTEPPTEPPVESKKTVTEPPKIAHKKRKQSPKQLANLSKGRGNPKVGASVKQTIEPPLAKPGESKTLLYVGIAIGVVASSIGIFKLYQMWKNKSTDNSSPQLAQPNLPTKIELTSKEIERLKKIEKAKENFRV